MFAFYILFERKLLKDYLSVKLNDTFFLQAQGTSKDLIGLKHVFEWPTLWNKFSFKNMKLCNYLLIKRTFGLV